MEERRQYKSLSCETEIPYWNKMDEEEQSDDEG